MASATPLSGFTVVEIGHTVAAPYAGMILAELGADVVKVETPGTGDYSRGMPPFRDGKSAVFQALNRNKRSVAIDLAVPDQAAKLKTYVFEHADALVHNLKFGAMARLGFGADEMLARKPGLVYCNIGAFGAVGPMRNRPGYDPLVQAFGGLMSIMGEDGRAPVRVGVSITDMASGLWAAIGIQAALIERLRTGKGGVVDTSLVETALAWLAYHFSSYFVSGTLPRREGSGLAQIVPYQAFATSDSYIMVAAGNDGIFRKLCHAIGRPDLASDPRFAANRDRVANRSVLIPLLESEFAGAPAAEWIARLGAAEVPCSPINTIDQVVEDPQTRALRMFQRSPDGSETLLGLPLSFDGVRPPFRHGAPTLGAHTGEILP
ncbi:MAG: CoA transferase [Burkholderiales bacterium]|nr:CoA transferase [Burkholderiales bacterium]